MPDPRRGGKRLRAGRTAAAPLLASTAMIEEGAANFRARAEQLPGSVLVVAEGELDLVGVPRLLDALPGPGDTPVVVDLGSVGFMDSSGLRSLLEARQRCRDAGRGFAIARPSKAVRRVLELVGLTSEFDVVERPVS